MFNRLLGYGEPETTDIHQEAYNPNSERHIKHIDERLANFNAKRDALLSLDQKAAAAAGLDTFVWLSGFTGGWGPYFAIAGYLAIYYCANEYYGRNHIKGEFDAALQEMFSIYHWVAIGKGPAITHQPKYQELLSAILPFTSDWRSLVFWDLGHAPTKIPAKILNIFEQSPHAAAIPLLKPDAETLPQTPSAQVVVLPDPRDWVTKTRPYAFFAETAANAKLKIYGQNFEESIKKLRN